MNATVYIVIYRGDPVDLMETRHTAFYIEFSDGTKTLMHATGGHGFFRVEEERNPRDPKYSTRFACLVYVGIVRSIDKSDFCSCIQTTPVDNTTRGWNCQNWIGDALKRMVLKSWISSTDESNAVSTMVDVVMLAGNEP
jgi:hypothetical protein